MIGGRMSRTVTADAERRTTSADVCIVATRATRTREESGGGTNERIARGSASPAGAAGSTARAASAIRATESPKTTLETLARSAERRAVASSRQERSFE